jgi:hypothetical protein
MAEKQELLSNRNNSMSWTYHLKAS